MPSCLGLAFTTSMTVLSQTNCWTLYPISLSPQRWQPPPSRTENCWCWLDSSYDSWTCYLGGKHIWRKALSLSSIPAPVSLLLCLAGTLWAILPVFPGTVEIVIYLFLWTLVKWHGTTTVQFYCKSIWSYLNWMFYGALSFHYAIQGNKKYLQTAKIQQETWKTFL